MGYIHFNGIGINPCGLQQTARGGSVAGSAAAAGIEESLWLFPIEDRRRLGSSREEMIEGFSPGNYLLLVDYTGRLFRKGKAPISHELAEICGTVIAGAEAIETHLTCQAPSRWCVELRHRAG